MGPWGCMWGGPRRRIPSPTECRSATNVGILASFFPGRSSPSGAPLTDSRNTAMRSRRGFLSCPRLRGRPRLSGGLERTIPRPPGGPGRAARQRFSTTGMACNTTTHQSKEEAFYFAAEAKAILAVLPELWSVDPQGLGEFVACSYGEPGRYLKASTCCRLLRLAVS